MKLCTLLGYSFSSKMFSHPPIFFTSRAHEAKLMFVSSSCLVLSLMLKDLLKYSRRTENDGPAWKLLYCLFNFVFHGLYIQYMPLGSFVY